MQLNITKIEGCAFSLAGSAMLRVFLGSAHASRPAWCPVGLRKRVGGALLTSGSMERNNALIQQFQQQRLGRSYERRHVRRRCRLSQLLEQYARGHAGVLFYALEQVPGQWVQFRESDHVVGVPAHQQQSGCIRWLCGLVMGPQAMYRPCIGERLGQRRQP